MTLQIDIHELARTGRTLEGTLEVAETPRLASLLAREEGQVRWQARGERRERPDGDHDDLLHLALSSELQMQCVRCLADAPVSLRVATSFRLVDTEEQAEREDLEDSRFDVLVGSPRFDLGELIEDEAIMALPSLPRHEDCALPDAADPVQAPVDPARRDSTPVGSVSNGQGAGEPRSGAGGRGESGQAENGERIRPFADLAERMKRRH